MIGQFFMPKSLYQQEFEPNEKVPLEGIRVLDLSRLVSGNMVTHVLADYGAEVVLSLIHI